jgi:hypothetical protein
MPQCIIFRESFCYTNVTCHLKCSPLAPKYSIYHNVATIKTEKKNLLCKMVLKYLTFCEPSRIIVMVPLKMFEKANTKKKREREREEI